ncbi:MAG: PhoH family protein [Deltaproteobacteria bacterium]|nr:PhoH family protein [Deltaproteobacteria bacterium]
MQQKQPLKTIQSHTVSLEKNEWALQVLGPADAHLKTLELNIPATIKSRGSDVTIEGTKEQIEMAGKCLQYLKDLAAAGGNISTKDVQDSIRICKQDNTADLKSILHQQPVISSKKQIYPRTLGQKKYVDAIKEYDLVFGVGPAGTGKTYLAMAVGVNKLLKGDVDHIILTRPAVEAGEKLGFLPGDLAEKVDPYLRPLMDALHEMIDYERVEKMLTSGQIEIAPIAFMRGRTLNNSYVILDEAQNCTREQMKMFLTRLGDNCTAVITGDITQIDLPKDTKSGLIQALKILANIDGIYTHQFDVSDVVRHPLVAKIITAYEKAQRIP